MKHLGRQTPEAEGSETPHAPLHGELPSLETSVVLHTGHHRFGVKIPGDAPLKY